MFALFYFVFEGKFQVQAPQGLYRRGDLTEGFLRYDFGGAYIWRGLYMEGRISEFYGSLVNLLLFACNFMSDHFLSLEDIN